MIVRARAEQDLPGLVRLLEGTHRDAGYPVRKENVRAGWLAAAGELAAWTAEQDGVPVGHVALHPPGGLSVPHWRAASGRDDDGLAVVSRLFSAAPGAGTRLLEVAVDGAHARGRVPVLEVQRRAAAYDFYLRRGWTVIGELDQMRGPVPVRVAALIFS